MDIRNSLLCAVLLAGCAAVNANEPFVYQGELNEFGSPANGLYDMEIAYYDAASGGTSIIVVPRDDVAVTDGVFQIQLPMPPADDARYLEFRIRAGISLGAYTTLAPRSYISAAPIASRSLDQPWSPDPSGDLIYGDGDEVVLINRENRIGAEFFGIGANTGGFAGMYISTTGDGGFPFYGFSAGGDVDAYLYFNENDQMTSSDDELTINIAGNERISFEQPGRVRAAAFAYDQPRSRSVMVPGDAFVSRSDAFGPVTNVRPGLYTEIVGGFNVQAVAPLNLPDGARITSVTGYFNDNSVTGELSVILYQMDPMIPAYNELALVTTVGMAPQAAAFTNTDVLDYTSSTSEVYVLSAVFNSTPGDTSLRLISVRVYYEIDSVE